MLDQWFSDLGDRLYFLRDRYIQWRGDRRLGEAIKASARARAESFRAWLEERRLGAAKQFTPRAIAMSVIAAVFIVSAFVWLYVATRGPADLDAPRRAWFMDANDGSLFRGMSDQLPPIDAPSMKKTAEGMQAGVRAYVFSCGSCSDNAVSYIGFIETYSPQVRDQILNRPPDVEGKPPVDLSGVIAKGQWVALPPKPGARPAVSRVAAPNEPPRSDMPAAEAAHTDEPAPMLLGGLDWVLMSSPEGQAIVKGAAGKDCGDGRLPAQCWP